MPLEKPVWIACVVATPPAIPSLDDLMKKSYLDLAAMAPKLELSRKTLDDDGKQIEAHKKEA